MIKLTSLLDELKVVNIARDKENPTHFLLYKDKVFLLDDNSNIKSLNTKIKQHIKTHPGITKGRKWGELRSDDVYDFLQRMAGLTPDVAVGEYRPKDETILVWNQGYIEPTTSLNVKKLAKQFNVKNIIYYSRSPTADDNAEDDKYVYSPAELKGDVPNIVYHGTTSVLLESILQYGLYPGQAPSRFEIIQHLEHIFFTASFPEAAFYAFHAKRVDKQKYENFPIIIELTIPDKNLLFPDYDADISTTSIFPLNI